MNASAILSLKGAHVRVSLITPIQTILQSE